MFNLQVTLSDFCSRKRQLIPLQSLIVVLRFGSIKFDIKLASNGQCLLGGKRIVLDITPQELKDMFVTFALGMFIENQQGKFFCLLSLEKLDFSDIVSGQEVYFHNDHQQIVYTANFSLIFNDFKDPRMPNKQKIENHKTFNELFKKPAIPNHNVPAKTMSSFLYGKKTTEPIKQKQSMANGKVSKTQSVKGKKNMGATTTEQAMKRTRNVPQLAATLQPQFQIYNVHDSNFEDEDENPPVMQFTNTAVDPLKGVNLLKTQMAQLNLTAPQSIKFMTAYESKNAFSKSQSKDTRNTIIKIQEKLKSNNQTSSLGGTNSFKENIDLVKVNRDELRNKAKIQMQAYQGNTSIKIPVLKDGKYELVELAHLNEQEIANFAKKQRELQLEEQKKKMVQKQLQKRQKQNSLLKKQLEEKEKLLAMQQYEAKKQKIELLKAKQQAEQNKKIALTKKISQHSQKSQDSYNDDEDKEDDYQKDSDQEKEEQQEQNNYQSDFQSMSMASAAQKKSRISMNSQKKHEQSESYNDSYDPDFQSFSQSLLGSQPRLSMSSMSESMRSPQPKRR